MSRGIPWQWFSSAPLRTALLCVLTALAPACSEEDSAGFISDNNEFIEVNNAASRLLVLGQSLDADGNRRVYFAATDGLGSGVAAEDLISGTTIGIDGSDLDPSRYSLSRADISSETYLSISFVADQSGSMSDKDLSVVRELYSDAVTALNPIMEGEYITFSETVNQSASFDTDNDVLLNSIANDTIADRGATALYDGLNTGVTNISARSKPAKIIVCSTDGIDNSSLVTREAVAQNISDSQVFVLMLGNLYADPDQLNELAGPRGIFVYTYALADLAGTFAGILQGFEEMAVAEIPAAAAGISSVTINYDGNSTDFGF